MSTKHVSAAEVVRFRDEAWNKYHTNADFLELIDRKFGPEATNGIKDLTKVKLRRRILGD
jgi:hypothetical protein